MLNHLKSRPIARFAFAGAAVSIAALPALAGTPKALTMVPSDAEVVVVMPDVGQLLSDMDRMNVMMGQMGKMEVTMMTSMVRGMPGLNLEGSAAVILDMQEDWDDEPDAIVLLPVSSFDDLTQGRRAVNGLVKMEIDNNPIYFRDLGSGYAAMSNNPKIVSSFSPAAHTIEQAQNMVGTAGNRVLASNDVMMYVNLDSMRPMLSEYESELEEQGEMIEMMGGDQAAQSFEAMVELYETAVSDGQAVVAGMSFDKDLGIAFDIGLQFAEGSESASLLMNDGDAGAYLNKVPDMDFFYAQAFDLSGQGIQKMLGEYGKMMQGLDATGALGGIDLTKLMSQFRGGAQVVGASDIMMMNGLLANSVVYTEGNDGPSTIQTMQKLYNNLGEIQTPGVGISGAFSDEPTMISGINAYSHEMTFDIDGQAMGGGGFGAPDPAMMMQVIYGPSRGPAGYAAQAGDGMVFTFSKDSDLLTKAYNAANGKGTMMANKSIATATKMLPDNRVMEAYVGIDHLLNTAGPMLMMFGIIPEFEPMDGLTPLAFGATADGGGVMLRSVLPMNTIQAVMEMIPEDALQMMGDGGDDDWGDEDDDGMSF
ncbi:MAG: hypothetical protein AB8C13_09250 [Phycisphaerales bacterium]